MSDAAFSITDVTAVTGLSEWAARAVMPSVNQSPERFDSEETLRLHLVGYDGAVPVFRDRRAISTQVPWTVYVIGREGLDEVKIGVAKDVTIRRSTLQTAHARPLEVLVTFGGGPQAERDLHILFRRERLSGEWFALSARVLDWIARQKTAGGAR